MTNERLEELMRLAGYAAPHLAARAKALASLILKDCAEQNYEFTKQQMEAVLNELPTRR